MSLHCIGLQKQPSQTSEEYQKAYSLDHFTKKFKLPKVVRVVSGIYDTLDEISLSSEEILTLHNLKKYETVRASTEDECSFHLPLNISSKVAVVQSELSANTKELYYDVQSLADDFPPLVVSQNAHSWLGIESGDIIKPIQTWITNPNKGFLECSILNKPSNNGIFIPLSYEAKFETLEKSHYNSLFLQEIVSNYPLPVEVRFLENRAVIQKHDINLGTPTSLEKLGVITLHALCNLALVVATTTDPDSVRVESLLNLPQDLDITVMPCEGSLKRTKKIDKRLLGFCDKNFVYGSTIIEERELGDDEFSCYEHLLPRLFPRKKPGDRSRFKHSDYIQKMGDKDGDKYSRFHENGIDVCNDHSNGCHVARCQGNSCQGDGFHRISCQGSDDSSSRNDSNGNFVTEDFDCSSQSSSVSNSDTGFGDSIGSGSQSSRNNSTNDDESTNDNGETNKVDVVKELQKFKASLKLQYRPYKGKSPYSLDSSRVDGEALNGIACRNNVGDGHPLSGDDEGVDEDSRLELNKGNRKGPTKHSPGKERCYSDTSSGEQIMVSKGGEYQAFKNEVNHVIGQDNYQTSTDEERSIIDSTSYGKEMFRNNKGQRERSSRADTYAENLIEEGSRLVNVNVCSQGSTSNSNVMSNNTMSTCKDQDTCPYSYTLEYGIGKNETTNSDDDGISVDNNTNKQTSVVNSNSYATNEVKEKYVASREESPYQTLNAATIASPKTRQSTFQRLQESKSFFCKTYDPEPFTNIPRTNSEDITTPSRCLAEENIGAQPFSRTQTLTDSFLCLMDNDKDLEQVRMPRDRSSSTNENQNEKYVYYSNDSPPSTPQYNTLPTSFSRKSKEKESSRGHHRKLTIFSSKNLTRSQSTADVGNYSYSYESITRSKSMLKVGKFLEIRKAFGQRKVKDRRKSFGGFGGSQDSLDSIPQDRLKTLNVDEVGKLLKMLGLHRYVKYFKDAKIDGNLLVELTDSMLVELHVDREIDRYKLRKTIEQGWLPKSNK